MIAKSIILSAVISLLLRKLNTAVTRFPNFSARVNLVTIIFLSLPHAHPFKRKPLQKDITRKRKSLKFFGNYYRMKLPEYKEGMEKMMEDKNYLYGSLIMDGYAQGVVLGKKYHLLRISYNVFMYGLILSVFAFIIASAFYGK